MATGRKDIGACKHGQSAPLKIHYFYVDKDLGAKKITCRSSSATQIKSKGTIARKPSPSNSDPYLNENCPFSLKKNYQKNNKGCVCIKDLEHDLSAIREQLYVLTQNKNIALSVTNELQGRYKQLLQKNEEQQRLIEKLRSQLRQVSQVCKKKRESSCSGGNNKGFLCELKHSVEKCESKLSAIYKDFQARKSTEDLVGCAAQKLTEKVDCLQLQLAKSATMQMRLEKDVAQSLTDRTRAEETCCILKRELQQSNNKVVEMDLIIADLKCQLLDLLKQLADQAERQRCDEDFEQRLRAKSAECERLRSDCTCLRGNLQCLSQENHDLNGIVVDLKRQVEQLSTLQVEYETKCQMQQTTNVQLEAKLKMFEERDAKRLKDIRALRSQNAAVIAELQRLKDFAEGLTRNPCKVEMEVTQCSCTVLPQATVALINSLYTCLRRIQECEKSLKLLRRMRSILALRDSQLNQAKREITTLKEELTVANEDNDQLARDLMFLQNAKADYIEYMEETVEVECSCTNDVTK